MSGSLAAAGMTEADAISAAAAADISADNAAVPGGNDPPALPKSS